MPYSKEAIEVLRKRAQKKRDRDVQTQEQALHDPAVAGMLRRSSASASYQTDEGPVLKRLDRWKALLKEVVSRPLGLPVNRRGRVSLSDRHQTAKDLQGMIKEGWVEVKKEHESATHKNTFLVPKKPK